MPEISALYAPATHAVHTAEVLAVPTLAYLPTGHEVHTLVPVMRVLYSPTVHAVHTAEVDETATFP